MTFSYETDLPTSPENDMDLLCPDKSSMTFKLYDVNGSYMSLVYASHYKKRCEAYIQDKWERFAVRHNVAVDNEDAKKVFKHFKFCWEIKPHY